MSHIEWSPQRMPMPRACQTVLCATSPIDISTMEIPVIAVAVTSLCVSIPIEPCMTIPSRPPTTVQWSTTFIPWISPYETSIPCPSATPRMSTLQCFTTTDECRMWMPSSFARTTVTWSSVTLRTPSTEIPYSPPTTLTWLIVTSRWRTTIPPRTTAPGSPTSRSHRSTY